MGGGALLQNPCEGVRRNAWKPLARRERRCQKVSAFGRRAGSVAFGAARSYHGAGPWVSYVAIPAGTTGPMEVGMDLDGEIRASGADPERLSSSTARRGRGRAGRCLRVCSACSCHASGARQRSMPPGITGCAQCQRRPSRCLRSARPGPQLGPGRPDQHRDGPDLLGALGLSRPATAHAWGAPVVPLGGADRDGGGAGLSAPTARRALGRALGVGLGAARADRCRRAFLSRAWLIRTGWRDRRLGRAKGFTSRCSAGWGSESRCWGSARARRTALPFSSSRSRWRSPQGCSSSRGYSRRHHGGALLRRARDRAA